MKRKTKKWLKKHINVYNIAIFILTLVIIISLAIIILPIPKINFDFGTSISSNTNNGKEIKEEDAKKIAIKKFQEMGEKVSKNDLSILRIQRNEKEYYYIKSPQNTVEISVIEGKITRVNGAVVE